MLTSADVTPSVSDNSGYSNGQRDSSLFLCARCTSSCNCKSMLGLIAREEREGLKHAGEGIRDHASERVD